MSEIAFASATALATKIQNKEISAVELLNFFLARADAHNDELNAIAMALSSSLCASARARKKLSNSTAEISLFWIFVANAVADANAISLMVFPNPQS